MERAELKSEIVKLLDACGVEHPKGHQGSKMARYHIGNHVNGPLTVAFEKNKASSVNIWCPMKVANYVSGVKSRLRYAKDLWTDSNAEGEKVYGRHAGLKAIPELVDADLITFTPQTLGEAKYVIEGIQKAAADGIT